MIQNSTTTATPPPGATANAPSAKESAAAAFAAGMEKLTGKSAAVAPQPERAAPVATEEQPKGEQSPKGRNTDPAETRYERARRAMLRSGVMKEDEFRKLDREDAIRRGLKLERQQNRQAADFAAAQRASQRKDQGSPPDAAASASSNAQTPAQNGLVELLDKLGLKGDSEAQALLQSYLSPVLQEQARLKAQLEQQAAGERPDANQVKRLTDLRAELSKSIIELGEDDEWRDVEIMAEKISGHPKYGDVDSNDETLQALFNDAIRLALDIDVGERAKPAAPQGAASRGLVETTGARAGVTASSDPREIARSKFAAAMPEIARRYAGQL